MRCYLGVDVGTSSVRAGLFTEEDGKLLSTAVNTISISNHQPDHYEQSTENIWEAVCITVKDAVSRACIRKEDVCGIGFDATCSLVVLDSECHPLSVNASGDSYWNVIMWMDHRAAGQVERINTTNHDVLKFVGGKMSPEMQLPKLLWLKENLKETCWNKAGHFFDLPDFLTWRATGSFSRSLCSLVCKWSYQVYSNKKGSWNDEFFRMANLSDLLADNYAKIGNDVRFPGVPCGSGLSSFGSAALGLCPGTPVGTSIIDAHAGGLGSMACVPTRQVLPELVYRMALICGTSSCHMTVSSDPTFVPGVWGPYFSAMIPGLWLNEGGQSATGKLLDHIVHTHPAFPGLRASAGEKKQHSFEFLNDMLSQLAAQGSVPSLAHLTSNIHVWPDFHGNRSPLADPTLRGMISGMTLSSTVEDLALLYLATVQAVAYGTKHILKEMEKHGYHIQVVCVCGGLRKNPLFVQTHADVTGLPLLLPDTQESVLLGAAILGAYATGNFSSIQSLMKKMGGSGRIVQPIPSDASYHDKKYGVFLKMLAHQREYQNLMKS